MRPLLEAVWQQAKNAPESNPIIAERPYVPPVEKKKRGEEEMFKVVEAEADEAAWVPVDGDEEALAPISDKEADAFVDATGEKVAGPKGEKKKGGTNKPVRTRIEPVHAGRKTAARRTAKQRKKVHDAKVKKRKAATDPPAAPVEMDAALAAEIEAIKADDARKGKYYIRKKTDV